MPKKELWKIFFFLMLGLTLSVAAVVLCLLGFDHATSVLLLGIAFAIWTVEIVRIVTVLVKTVNHI